VHCDALCAARVEVEQADSSPTFGSRAHVGRGLGGPWSGRLQRASEEIGRHVLVSSRRRLRSLMLPCHCIYIRQAIILQQRVGRLVKCESERRACRIREAF